MDASVAINFWASCGGTRTYISVSELLGPMSQEVSTTPKAMANHWLGRIEQRSSCRIIRQFVASRPNVRNGSKAELAVSGYRLRAAAGAADPGEEFVLVHRLGEDEALDRVAAHRAQDVRLSDRLDGLSHNLAVDALDQVND